MYEIGVSKQDEHKEINQNRLDLAQMATNSACICKKELFPSPVRRFEGELFVLKTIKFP